MGVPQEPAKPQVQEALSTSDADELVEVEQEEEERKDVMASEALREAAKAHSEATSAGKVEQTKWKAEMDSFTEEMAANDGQDLIVEDDTTMMIDLDELD